MIVSIVGGGATGITILRHLAELAGSDRYRNAVTGIQIFDKSGFDGGVAYRTQSDHHLLNMKASKMSIRRAMPGSFCAGPGGTACNAAKTITAAKGLSRLSGCRARGGIEQCRAAGIPVDVEHAEVIRMRFSPDRDVLLTTDGNVTHISSVLILCTGHNAPEDHYGLAGSPNYIRDPYTRFAFADCDGVEVGILGSGLTAVDSVTALAGTHRAVKITCFSRSGLFPTVQPSAIPAITDDFRDALHRYVQSREQIGADEFADKLSGLLLATTGIAATCRAGTSKAMHSPTWSATSRKRRPASPTCIATSPASPTWCVTPGAG